MYRIPRRIVPVSLAACLVGGGPQIVRHAQKKLKKIKSHLKLFQKSSHLQIGKKSQEAFAIIFFKKEPFTTLADLFEGNSVYL